jgi:ribosomal protein S20
MAQNSKCLKHYRVGDKRRENNQTQKTAKKTVSGSATQEIQAIFRIAFTEVKVVPQHQFNSGENR